MKKLSVLLNVLMLVILVSLAGCFSENTGISSKNETISTENVSEIQNYRNSLSILADEYAEKLIKEGNIISVDDYTKRGESNFNTGDFIVLKYKQSYTSLEGNNWGNYVGRWCHSGVFYDSNTIAHAPGSVSQKTTFDNFKRMYKDKVEYAIVVKFNLNSTMRCNLQKYIDSTLLNKPYKFQADDKYRTSTLYCSQLVFLSHRNTNNLYLDCNVFQSGYLGDAVFPEELFLSTDSKKYGTSSIFLQF